MLMAIIFLPTMGTLIGPRSFDKTPDNLIELSGKDGDPLKTKGPLGLYVKTINSIIRYPGAVIAVTLFCAYLIVKAFGASMAGPTPKPIEFFTDSDGDQVYVIARARGNTTARSELDIALEIERRINGIEGINSVYSVTGTPDGAVRMDGITSLPNDMAAQIYTELEPFGTRPPTRKIMDDLAAAVADMPGIKTEIISIAMGPPIGKDIAVQLASENMDELTKATEIVRAKFDSLDALIDVEDTLPPPGIEWEIVVDQEEAGRLGLNVSQIGAAVQFMTEGTLVGQYRPLDADEEVDIRVRYPQSSRDLAKLDGLRIQTPAGSLPLSAVVDLKPKRRQDQINRRDQSLVYEIRANTRQGEATNQQVELVRDWLSNEADLPASVSYKFLGQDEENAQAMQFFIAAGIAIIFMMGVILLLQFNNFYHVFLTLTSVILSVFGVLLGLTFYPYVSIILCGTGIIALAGIVVNNNIVLIDTYQRLLENGFEPIDAAMRTAAQRVRPVILTTVTTIAGLMPLVLGWQADVFTGEFSTKGTSTSDVWQPVSYVITYGLAFATLLTLIVTPVLLAAPTVWGNKLRKLFGRTRKSSAPNPETV